MTVVDLPAGLIDVVEASECTGMTGAGGGIPPPDLCTVVVVVVVEE